MSKVERVPLGEVADINPDVAGELWDDESQLVSFVPMSAVSEVSASVTAPEDREFAKCRKGYTPFQRGDILVAKITPCFENGKIAFADIPRSHGFGSTEFHVIRPHSAKVDARYLLHVLRHPEFRLKGERRMTGSAGQRRVPINFLSTFDIPLPPLPLQRHLAEVLDRAEALRAKRRAALAQLDSLTQSLFLDLFGDPIRNLKGFLKARIGELAKRITKGESPKWQGYEYQSEGALFVTSENVKLGKIDLSSPKFIPLDFNRKLFRSELRAGDILINLVGASIGRSCIFPGYHCPSNINQAVAVVTLDSNCIDRVYLSALLISEYGQWMLLNNRVEGARANISLTDIRELEIPVPPLALQQEFARRVAVVEKLKAAQRAALAELDALFATLQHRAFRGEL